MALTKSLEYIREETLTTATEILTINTLKYNFINDIIANPPSGWVLKFVYNPTPSSTVYQGNYVDFTVDNLYVIRLRSGSLTDGTSDLSYRRPTSLVVHFLNLTGEQYLIGFNDVYGEQQLTIISGSGVTKTLKVSITSIVDVLKCKFYLVNNLVTTNGNNHFCGYFLSDLSNINYDKIFFNTFGGGVLSTGRLFGGIKSIFSNNVINNQTSLEVTYNLKFNSKEIFYNIFTPYGKPLGVVTCRTSTSLTENNSYLLDGVKYLYLGSNGRLFVEDF